MRCIQLQALKFANYDEPKDFRTLQKAAFFTCEN